jgi:hypothetical protein
MSDLSRRSFFAALAGAPVAAAAALAATTKATPTFIGLDMGGADFSAMIVHRGERLHSWRVGKNPASRFVRIEAEQLIERLRDAQQRALDTYEDSFAIDSMINEGGRDWA